jgi:hypothetical protein
MNAERILHLLEDYMWPILSGGENNSKHVYMHDGAPPYFALSVYAWLDQNFPRHWLGRRGFHEVQISRLATFFV